MVSLYSDLKDSNGGIISGRTKFFIEKTDDEGSIINYLSGTLITPETSGTLFIVDDWLIPQVDKLLFIDGELIVKEGETLDEPVKTERELQREELLRQIAELDAEEDNEQE